MKCVVLTNWRPVLQGRFAVKPDTNRSVNFPQGAPLRWLVRKRTQNVVPMYAPPSPSGRETKRSVFRLHAYCRRTIVINCNNQLPDPYKHDDERRTCMFRRPFSCWPSSEGPKPASRDSKTTVIHGIRDTEANVIPGEHTTRQGSSCGWNNHSTRARQQMCYMFPCYEPLRWQEPPGK